MKGTHLNDKIPCVRIDWEYNKNVNVETILRAFYDPESRMKWDDKVADIIEVQNNHPNMSILLTRNIKILLFDARQFIDKRIVFKCNDENSNYPEQVSIISN